MSGDRIDVKPGFGAGSDHNARGRAGAAKVLSAPKHQWINHGGEGFRERRPGDGRSNRMDG